jgi:hypothetical protein
MSSAIVDSDTETLLTQLQLANLQVFCDFDGTLTTPKSLNSWSVVERHSLLASSSKVYFERTAAIRTHFRTIEAAPQSEISLARKRSEMCQWWSIAFGLLIDERPTRQTIMKAVDEVVVAGKDFALRRGVDAFLRASHSMNVPVTILSAGIGDVVVLVLKRFDLLLPNVTVCRFVRNTSLCARCKIRSFVWL